MEAPGRRPACLRPVTATTPWRACTPRTPTMSGPSATPRPRACSSLAWHWNGTGWTRITTPQPSTIAQALAGVSGVSGSDVWAVGFQSPQGGVTNTLALHWNGTAWTKVASINAGVVSVLENVYARASNDVWAVGYSEINSTSGRQVLVEHWDGSTWSAVIGANPVTCDDVLFNVAATSSTDASAVGYTDTGTGTTRSTLIEHWDGTSWSVVSSPNRGTSHNVC